MKIETLSAATRGINAGIPAVSIALLIPAYRPGPALIEVVRSLDDPGFTGIVVVDDGSGPEYAWIFDLLEQFAGVKVVRHAVNLGKGAALKTGMNYALVEHPGLAGIVTADADGQHDPADICRVAPVYRKSGRTRAGGARIRGRRSAAQPTGQFHHSRDDAPGRRAEALGYSNRSARYSA